MIAVHEIVLDSPHLNALSIASMTALRDEIRGAGGQPLLLRGSGRAFSAGLDLGEVAELKNDELRLFVSLLDSLFLELFTYPAPTVAWLNGHAIAGGCLLALACDLRIAAASEAIKIGLNEVALGISFPPGALAIARYRIASHCLDEVLLGARLYNPREAYLRGLIDEVIDDSGEHARSSLENLAAHPRAGYASAKASLRGAVAKQAAAALPAFIQDSLQHWNREQLAPRIALLLGKKKPKNSPIPPPEK